MKKTIQFLLAAILLTAGVVGAFDGISRIYPSDANVRNVVQGFTKSEIPDAAEILWARGDLLGGSRGEMRLCALIRMSKWNGNLFRGQMRTDPSYSYSKSDFSCPAARRAAEIVANEQLIFSSAGALSHHAGYAVYNDPKNTTFLLMIEVF